MPIILEGPNGEAPTRSMTLRVGEGLALASTPDGLPILKAAGDQHEIYVVPSANDAQAINDAMYQGKRVRLARGVFNIGQPIFVPPGVVITGAGTGAGTASGAIGTPFTQVIKADYAGPAFVFTNSADAGLEGLRITGAGRLVGSGNTAILCDVGLGAARRLRFRDLVLENLSEFGIFLRGSVGASIQHVRCTEIGYDGVFLDGGSGASLSGILAEYCGKGIRLSNVAGAVVSACDVDMTAESYAIVDCASVKLDGCASHRCSYLPLRIGGGYGVVVDAFHSTNEGVPQPNTPHLTVNAGGSEIVINAMTIANGSGAAPAAEVDVSLAGSPVIVSAHNFTRINSAGKFAEPNVTVRP